MEATATAENTSVNQAPVLAPKVNIPEEYKGAEDKSDKLNDGLTVPFFLRLGSQNTMLAFKEAKGRDGQDRVILPEDVREAGGAWVLHETPEGQLLIGRKKEATVPGQAQYDSVKGFTADDFRNNQVILPLGNLNLAVVGFDPATREIKVCKAEKPTEPIVPIIPEPTRPIPPEPVVPIPRPWPLPPENPPSPPVPGRGGEGWRLKLPELRLPRLRRIIPFIIGPLISLIPPVVLPDMLQRPEPPIPKSPMPEVWGPQDSYQPKSVPAPEQVTPQQPQERLVIEKEPDFEYHHYTTPNESVKGFTERQLAVEFAKRYAPLYENQYPELQELVDLAKNQPNFSPDEASLDKTLKLINEKFPGLTEAFQSEILGSILKYNPDGTIKNTKQQDHLDSEDLNNPGNNFQFGVQGFRTPYSKEMFNAALAESDQARQDRLIKQYGGGYQPV